MSLVTLSKLPCMASTLLKNSVKMVAAQQGSIRQSSFFKYQTETADESLGEPMILTQTSNCQTSLYCPI